MRNEQTFKFIENVINFQLKYAKRGMTLTSELRKLTWDVDGFRLLWIAVLLVTFWIYYKIISFFSPMVWPIRKPNAAIFFAAYHEKIRRVFKCQRQETLNVLFSGVDRVMRSGGGDNSVLLLLAPEGASGTALKLANLLVHCILIGYQQSADLRNVKEVMVDGGKYAQDQTDWKFFMRMRRHLRRHGVAAVLDAQELHPHVLQRLVTLCSPHFSFGYMSVIILVVDVKKRFTNHQLTTTPANSLGKIFLEELLIPYPRDELVNLLTARCVLVLPENHLSML